MDILLGYSLNLEYFENLNTLSFETKSSRYQSMVQSLNMTLVCFKKLFILDVDCDDNQENEKKLLMGYTYTTNTFYRFIRTPILNQDRRV